MILFLEIFSAFISFIIGAAIASGVTMRKHLRV